MLRFAWFLCWKDLQIMLRQRETLMWLFLMPPIFFYFIGTVTGGGKLSGGVQSDPLAVESPADAGFLGGELERRLEEQHYELARFEGGVRADLEPVGADESPTPFDEYTRRLTIPSDYTARALAGEQVPVTVARTGRGLASDLDELRVRLAVYTVLADLVAAQAGTLAEPAAGVTAADFERLHAMPRALSLEVQAAGKRKRIPQGFEQTVPGTMVMFTLMIILTTGATTLLVERRQGLLRRLASAPVSRGAVVFGKWGGKLALAAVQVSFAMVLGTLGFGVDWGPAWPMVVLVMLAYASLIASLGILVGSLAKSEGQAIGLGVLSANLLAALGGCWWPIEVTSPFMQKLSLFLPTGWAMDALHKLVSFGAGASSVLPHVLGMSLGALLLGKFAARHFKFE